MATHSSLSRVLEHIAESNWPADLVAMTGDLIQDDSRAAYDRFCDLMSRLELPVYCVPGNHDIRDLMRDAVSQDPFHYCASVHINNWLITGIDSCISGDAGGRVDDGEMDLLANDLDRRAGDRQIEPLLDRMKSHGRCVFSESLRPDPLGPSLVSVSAVPDARSGDRRPDRGPARRKRAIRGESRARIAYVPDGGQRLGGSTQSDNVSARQKCRFEQCFPSPCGRPKSGPGPLSLHSQTPRTGAFPETSGALRELTLHSAGRHRRLGGSEHTRAGGTVRSPDRTVGRCPRRHR